MYAFLDESGDLGFSFSKGSSRYFIITILKTRDEIGIKRCLKKIRKKKLKKQLKHLPEFKGNNCTPKIRKEILKCLQELNIEINCIIVDKNKVFSELRDMKFKLYNYVAANVLPGALTRTRTIYLVADKLTGKKIIRDDFDSYIRWQIEKRSFYPKVDIKISHFDSKNSPGLQACDVVCWSVFRKYESGDDSYYNIIKNKIKREKELFK
ncbi:MAG: DUF3800 domain-containing protein [Candidatus Hydrothermarchaeaceae archaeon]